VFGKIKDEYGNDYTSFSVSDLNAAVASLADALVQLSDRYQKELARQIANDNLCKEFANAAEPFNKYISDAKDKITHSQADLGSQLKYVEERLASLSADGAPIAHLDALARKMEEAAITNNRHTILTDKDIHVQWNQYNLFLQRKKTMLQDEIERERLKGVTQEQFKEIEDNFKQFDKNSNGILERKEFKACLYSLGEEKSNSEVDALLKQYGDSSKIPYEGFKNFMVNVLGVSDSKEDILAGFDLINRGASFTTPEKLDIAGLGQKDIDYFSSTAPKAEGGFNHKLWTDDMFSR